VAGSNAANIFRNCKGFQPVPTAAPIGAHLIGYLRDGSVPVIKTLQVLDTNHYIVGYKVIWPVMRRLSMQSGFDLLHSCLAGSNLAEPACCLLEFFIAF
jgi:hypothetical protein